MGDSFRDGNAWRNVGQLVVLLAVIAALIAIPWALSVAVKAAERRANRSPGRLFRELCRVHGLKASSRRLLMRIAQSHSIEHPAAVFLMSECFAAEKLPSTLAAQNVEIAAMREKLFGVDSD